MKTVKSKGAVKGRGAREQHLLVIEALCDLSKIAGYLKEQDWEAIRLISEYVKHDVPVELSKTDPALYKRLREAITNYHLAGWTKLHVPEKTLITRNG